MSGPLSGVRVLDLTTVAMGPYATQIFGDMGADVIKIESGSGDMFRQAAPQRNADMGAAFLNLNRNKRSVVLDLKSAAGRDAVLALVETADVFVSNLRPQSMRALRLDYDTLRAINPRLVYCGAYGFSEKGAYAGRPAFDDIIQSMSGVAALQAKDAGNEGAEPAYVNTIVADKAAGLTVAYAVAMALFERERSGEGQAIEVPMFETLVSFAMVEHLAGETFRPAVGPMGYQRILSRHRRPYRTRDGFIGLMPYTDRHWTRFFALAGRPDLAADVRFTTMGGRSKNIDALYRHLSEIVAQRTTAAWMDLLAEADIPMTPVSTLDEVLADRHLASIGFFGEADHPSEGPVRTLGIPVSFSRTPGAVRRLAPNLGEHTDEILREIDDRAET